MGREREGRWSDGAREKRSAGKKRRRTSRLFSEGLQLRSRTGSMREQTKEYPAGWKRSEEHTSELQSRGHLVCRLLLEKKNPGRIAFVEWADSSPLMAASDVMVT